jgi:hypothetical protein
MAKQTYHVTPDLGGRWVVRKTGSDRADGAFSRQRDAIEYAKDEARRESKKGQVDVVIHKRDGRIGSKDSYGSDPRPPAGRKH